MSIKDFIVLSKLGEGAYSSVYKVQRRVDQKIYALKKVKMSNLSEKQQQNALNEVRILASIKCKYIVAYKQAFIEGNSLCIVMQFADDGDLYQKIVEYKKMNMSFDEDFIWRTLIQISKGLSILHSLNILHRDLKSANVFLNKNGSAKLGDLNVSKITKNGLLYTQTGTPYYASPEVWKEKPYDCKSDIWSLGCVIYEMTTLKPPFRGEDMDALYNKVIKGSYHKIGDSYSKSLSNIIKLMLQVNPKHRPTAQQLYQSLKEKIQSLNIPFEGKQIEKNHEMLKTIYFRKNQHYVTDRLPRSTYESYDEKEIRNQTQQVRQKKVASLSKKINLPKLDQIINANKLINNSYIVKPKKNMINISEFLKIEGNISTSNQRRLNQQMSGHSQIYKLSNINGSIEKHKIMNLPRLK